MKIDLSMTKAKKDKIKSDLDSVKLEIDKRMNFWNKLTPQKQQEWLEKDVFMADMNELYQYLDRIFFRCGVK